MSEYPYAHVASKMKDFLERIPSTGIPVKVTYNELVARGFKSTNDRRILGVLKNLALVDAEGIPTEHWNSYRNRSRNKKLLAMLIRNAYSELFSMYPEAQERSDEEIRNFIASKTKVGEDSLQRIVSTFNVLCAMADFSGLDNTQSDVQANHEGPRWERAPEEVTSSEQTQKSSEIAFQLRSPLVSPVHINIHIHLPETADAQTTDAFIQSIARHILNRNINNVT